MKKKTELELIDCSELDFHKRARRLEREWEELVKEEKFYMKVEMTAIILLLMTASFIVGSIVTTCMILP